MSNNVKNWLGIAGIIAILVAAYAALSFSGTFRDLTPTNASFSVSGEGKVVAIPDIATFSYGVITEGGMDINKLQDENSKKGNAIIAMLKKQGVEAKDIKTSSYNISARYTQCDSWITKKPCPPATIVGYTVSQSVYVKVRDFTKVSDLLGGVATLGANNVSSLNFSVDEPELVKTEARAEAIKSAKEKAQMMAKTAGFTLGRLLSIDEGGNRGYYYDNYAMPSVSMKAESSGTVAPTVEPGSQDVNVTVTLRYEIR